MSIVKVQLILLTNLRQSGLSRFENFSYDVFKSSITFFNYNMVVNNNFVQLSPFCINYFLFVTFVFSTFLSTLLTVTILVYPKEVCPIFGILLRLQPSRIQCGYFYMSVPNYYLRKSIRGI